MARRRKVRARTDGPRYRVHASLMRPMEPMRRRKVGAQINVGATGNGHGPRAFQACARIGTSGACAHGKNPRKAIAKALKMVATNLSKRKGAFAGYKKRRR